MMEQYAHDAETIALRVQQTGVSVHWSDVLVEKVAFIRDDSVRYRRLVPRGVVAYTCAELEALYPEDAAPLAPSLLRLIHATKRETMGTVVSSDPIDPS